MPGSGNINLAGSGTINMAGREWDYKIGREWDYKSGREWDYPDMTFAVDWALKTNYLFILHLFFPNIIIRFW